MIDKSIKYDIITQLSNEIGGCFGNADRDFAMHPMDVQRAKELRKLAVDNDISLKEVQNIICGHIYRYNLKPEYEKEQRDKAVKFFASKLN